MDSSVANTLRELTQSIERLAGQRDEVRLRLRQAREEIADLRARLAAAQEEIHGRNLDVEFLSLSHKLADNPQALADARATVRGMLAKVEKALALLKDDARI